ncbi:unnamed protein product [Durusdinium trenchii]|uniref:Uncharacterized protein n=1 Tax=Durusdinium trenchii TaxID=1381693 RepID=A0ABP0SBM9_9DINO
MQAPTAALEAATAELQKMQMDIGLHCGTVGDGPEGIVNEAVSAGEFMPGPAKFPVQKLREEELRLLRTRSELGTIHYVPSPVKTAAIKGSPPATAEPLLETQPDSTVPAELSPPVPAPAPIQPDIQEQAHASGQRQDSVKPPSGGEAVSHGEPKDPSHVPPADQPKSDSKSEKYDKYKDGLLATYLDVVGKKVDKTAELEARSWVCFNLLLTIKPAVAPKSSSGKRTGAKKENKTDSKKDKKTDTKKDKKEKVKDEPEEPEEPKSKKDWWNMTTDAEWRQDNPEDCPSPFKPDCEEPLFQMLQYAVRCSNCFYRLLYWRGLWLKPHECKYAACAVQEMTEHVHILVDKWPDIDLPHSRVIRKVRRTCWEKIGDLGKEVELGLLCEEAGIEIVPRQDDPQTIRAEIGQIDGRIILVALRAIDYDDGPEEAQKMFLYLTEQVLPRLEPHMALAARDDWALDLTDLRIYPFLLGLTPQHNCYESDLRIFVYDLPQLTFIFSDQGMNFFPEWRDYIPNSVFVVTEALTPRCGPSCFNPWKDLVIPGHTDFFRARRMASFNLPSEQRSLLFNFHGRDPQSQ